MKKSHGGNRGDEQSSNKERTINNMIIISHNEGIVNIYAQNGKNAIIDNKEEKTAKFKKKTAEMKQKSLIVSEKMKKINFKRGLRMEHCADTIHFYKCPNCGKYEITNMERCRDRMCPLCNWILARQRLINMVEVLNKIGEEDKYNFFFLTLTIRNVKPKEIDEALKCMAKAWDKMMKRRIVKENLKGWARSTEITYNEITHTVHPHYHVILVYDKNFKDILDGAYFKPTWKETLQITYDPVIDFRPIRAKAENNDNEEQAKIYGAVLETFKYSTKSNDLINMPLKEFTELVNGISNKRMVSFGGIIKKTRKELNIIDEEAEEQEELKQTKTCECGAEMLLYTAEWATASSGYKETFKEAYRKAE